MQYSRHRLAWLASTAGGGLGADGDRISLSLWEQMENRMEDVVGLLLASLS